MIKLKNKDGKDMLDLLLELSAKVDALDTVLHDAEDLQFDLEHISGIVDDMKQICTNVIAGRKNDL